MRAVSGGTSRLWLALGLGLFLAHTGCGRGGNSGKGGRDAGTGSVAVDVKEVKRGRLRSPLMLVGTTQPLQEVAMRARVEGHLETLSVDVGDAVAVNQELGRMDPAILDAEVREAEASLAGAQAEAASAAAGVAQAKSALEQSRLALAQAEVEAQRYQGLAERGISSRQEAEQRATAARTSQQAVQAATQQVVTQESLATAAAARVRAQEALLMAAKELRSFAILRSPIAGRVMARGRSQGDLVRPGDEVLRIGDFSQVEVAVSVSELELSRVKPGQKVPVRIDAFGDTAFTGTVARISPQADPVSRLVPLEVVLDNPEGRIGSGLLARVQLDNGGEEQLLVLESALLVGEGPRDGGGRPAASGEGRVFVVTGAESNGGAQVEARPVKVGERADGQAEILSGLQEGDRVVVRSQRPLQQGTVVIPSALSDSGAQGEGGSGRE
jgi:HlyD family secretion protein